jgi:copper transport protein
MHGPATAVVDFGDVDAHVSVEPGTAGRNTIHLMFEQADGEMVMLEEVKVSATLASRNIGPLEFEAEGMGHAGEWRVEGADLTIPGDWQLRIEARRGEFELLTEATSISIREES